MSFPRYDRNKDSGVGWLGEVPEHWEIVQSRRLFSERKESAIEGERQLTASQKHGVLYQDEYTALEGQKVTQVIKGHDILKHVEPNDFVISMRSFQGGIEWCGYRGSISSAYVMLIPCEKIHARFFYYLFKCAPYIQALQSTTNLVRDGQALRYSNFVQVHLPLCPFDEQTDIAAFLDRETAKIDALVAEQERLIELLQEKRQAVISHAVTKGLNPDTPMKPSGIEWLGDVPEHWAIGAIKRFFSASDGRRVPLSAEERGDRQGMYPYYGASGIIDHIDEYIFDEDLILVSEDGANLVNRSTPIAFVARGKYWVNNHAHILRPSDDQLLFWAERIEAIDVTPVITGAAQPKLTIDALMKLMIAVPSGRDERHEIQQYLIRCKEQCAQLIAESTAAIKLLRERRTALVSAAVTGKIDVRGLVSERDKVAA